MTGFRVAVPLWANQDGITDMIAHELRIAGHEPVCYVHSLPVPPDIHILLTFGPYDRVLPVWESVSSRKGAQRPRIVHWNTEGMPDLSIPYQIVQWVGAFRSWVGRLNHSQSKFDRWLSRLPPVRWLDQRMYRYRYVGDYQYAYQKGWLNVLADSSQVYSAIRSRGGLPTVYAPWGGSAVFYEDLDLDRDIDVLWMGNRSSQRRSRILDQLCRELQSCGVKVYLADNLHHPFIFNSKRTEFLNRAKITLNITRTWFDDNFSRFAMAAPNRSLIVSEPLLPHCSEFKPAVHYVSAEIPALSRTILYYLEHVEERRQIADNAYRLVTGELQFANSLKKMLEPVENGR